MVTGCRLGAQLAGRSATMTPMGAVYLRVLEDLRDQIRGGLLAPGDRVPSRNAIIAKYGVGETAAKHALQVLAAEGLIETRAGSGSYVRPEPKANCLEHGRPGFPGSPFGLPPGPAKPLVSAEHWTDRACPPRRRPEPRVYQQFDYDERQVKRVRGRAPSPLMEGAGQDFPLSVCVRTGGIGSAVRAHSFWA